MREEATTFAGLKARDVTAWGKAPGHEFENDPSPVRAGQECVDSVTAFQASVILRDNNLGLRSSDSRQPRLPQDGLSALNSQAPTSRHATCNLTSRSGVMDMDELAAPENA